MRAAIVLAGLLAVGSTIPAIAAEAVGQTPSTTSAPDCASAESPAAQLVCRDPALAAAAGKLDATVKAFAEETGEPGREALASGQRMWGQRRDAACPVTEADLNDPKKAKDRAACLARQYADRTSALEDERAARRAPVADQPVTITEAAPPRAIQPPPRAFLPKQRQPGVAGLTGRWAKADPATRTPIDDCRSSYLEISKADSAKDMVLGLHDPRIAGMPVEGRVMVEDGDLGQGLAFRAEAPQPDAAGIAGTLRLGPADMPRLDRLFLRLDKPIAFGATFVRCR